MARLGVLAASLCGLGVAGCISAPDTPPPAWFTAQQAEIERGYPSLQDVPRTSEANTDAGYWTRLQSDLVAAGAGVKSHPRAVWTQPQDPVAFLEEARAELEATRASHE